MFGWIQGGFLGTALAGTLLVQTPEFDLVRSEITLRVEPAELLVAGEATLTIAATASPVANARFSLNNRFQVSSVKRDGSDTPFELGDRIAEGRALLVPLDPPLAPGKQCAITFVYEGMGEDPGEQDSDWMGIVLVREDEVRMSHQAQWCPIVPRDDRARSKRAAPVELVLDLPAGFESLGPGELEGVKKQRKRELHHWVSERPVQPSFLAGAFQAQTLKLGKLRVRVLSTPAHASGAKAWAGDALESLRTLSELFGTLDVAAYGLGEMCVRNRSKSYNYEADGFSVYDGVLFDGRAPDLRKIAHEVGHLWFGGAVDAVGPGERFLTEGLAEFAAWSVLAERVGEEAELEAIQQGLRRYSDSSGDEHSLAKTDFGSPRYAQVAYAKGAFVMRTLESWIGRDAVRSGLTAYVAAARDRGGAASLDDFLMALRAPGGEAVDRWADDWLRRAGSPSYTVELTGDKSGKLIQTGEFYRNPVELELVFHRGKTRSLTVTPTGRVEEWTADVPSRIASVKIDPNLRVLFPRD